MSLQIMNCGGVRGKKDKDVRTSSAGDLQKWGWGSDSKASL